jgi:drug/metabolite transporter (DMT)-like permease
MRRGRLRLGARYGAIGGPARTEGAGANAARWSAAIMIPQGLAGERVLLYQGPMRIWSVSPIVAGTFMGVGQYAMGRLASSLPLSGPIRETVGAALVSPYSYAFAIFNLVATVLYFFSLRHLPLTQAYIMFVASMSVTVLFFDLYANRTALSAYDLAGVALGFAGITLLAVR